MTKLARSSYAFLISCPGIGHQRLADISAQLAATGITWQEFWESGPALWQKLSISQNLIDRIQNMLSEYSISDYEEWLTQKDIRVIVPSNEEYPPLLATIERPPQVLFATGKRLDFSVLPIAVVGTRHMTSYGKLVTEKITAELVMLGAQIVSGGMYGVDSCAHQAALTAQGSTIAVLGYGFEHVYPRSHAGMLSRLRASGMTCISPFSPRTRPVRGNFPARNAIVAGMSAAVVVTEAAEKSGTHITAEYATEFGRAVCAVPGPITSPYSAGTAWLVNQGATLVSSGSEVLAEVGGEVVGKNEQSSISVRPYTNKQRTVVLAAIKSNSILGFSDLLEKTNLAEDELLELLTGLEMQGAINKIGANWSISYY